MDALLLPWQPCPQHPQGPAVKDSGAPAEEPEGPQGEMGKAPEDPAGLGQDLPMALRACLSSRAKAVRGTSSDTGMTATVERLLAGFPESHLLPAACSPNW